MRSVDRTIRALFRVVDDRAWDELEAFFAPTAIYARPGFADLVGRGEILRFYEEVRELQGRHQELTVVGDHTRAVCLGRFVGTKGETQVDVLFADAYEFEDGRIVRRRTYFHHRGVGADERL